MFILFGAINKRHVTRRAAGVILELLTQSNEGGKEGLIRLRTSVSKVISSIYIDMIPLNKCEDYETVNTHNRRFLTALLIYW